MAPSHSDLERVRELERQVVEMKNCLINFLEINETAFNLISSLRRQLKNSTLRNFIPHHILEEEANNLSALENKLKSLRQEIIGE